MLLCTLSILCNIVYMHILWLLHLNIIYMCVCYYWWCPLTTCGSFSCSGTCLYSSTWVKLHNIPSRGPWNPTGVTLHHSRSVRGRAGHRGACHAAPGGWRRICGAEAGTALQLPPGCSALLRPSHHHVWTRPSRLMSPVVAAKPPGGGNARIPQIS